MSVFNINNTEWEKGNYSLFLGESPALFDTVNVSYPKLEQLYHLQKSIDWKETEVKLEQSRMDMTTAPPEAVDLMLENLAYQWEADSIASRSIASLFAPFVTNSELWGGWLKISEIEVLHSRTYSEIIRQCVPEPKEVFKRVMRNIELDKRVSVIGKCFEDLRIAGAKYTLGMINADEAYPIVMKAVVALFCLERLQFMGSFGATFGVVEDTNQFVGIGMLVAKIMQDERWIHAEFGREILRIEFATDRGAIWRVKHSEEIRQIVDEVVQGEYAFSKHLFSNGRKVGSGYNEKLANEWVDWNAIDVYDTLMLKHNLTVTENPLKYMNNWLDLDRFQNANQEQDNTNYVLNSVVDDVEEDYIFS